MRHGKQFLTGLLAGVCFLMIGMTALATDANTEDQTAEQIAEQEKEGKTPEQIQEEKEKAEAYAMPIGSNALAGWPQGPAVYAESAIVMDMNSRAILYAKNIDDQNYPASITKILTTLVALENAELTDKVTFTEDCISFLEYGDAQIGMTPGEELSLMDALYGVLLASANEVSYAVAQSVGTKMGGDYNTFIEEMNTRAKELGCTGSSWMNANGLHDEQHYTTAHDMALITAEAFQHEEFKTIIKTLDYRIAPTNLMPEQRVFQQNHKMVFPENYYYYQHCIGGKTGFTDQAKTTLVTLADNGDMPLVAVNLRSYGVDTYTDTRATFDYAYGQFFKVPLKEAETSSQIERFADEAAYVVLPKDASFTQLEKTFALSEGGEPREAIVTYTYEGQQAGSTRVILSEAYYKEMTGIKDPILKDTDDTDNKKVNVKPEKEETGLSLVAKILIGAGAALLLFLIFLRRLVIRRKKEVRRRGKTQKKHTKRP